MSSTSANLGLTLPTTTDNVSVASHITGNFEKIDKAMLPVGSMYFNISDATNPATLLGYGTWVQLTDCYIVARGTTFGASGGDAEMHVHPNSQESGAASDALTAGLVRSSNSDCVGFNGRVLVSESGYTSDLLPVYAGVYAWYRTA